MIEKIRAYQEANLPIYFTQDTHSENYLETQEGRNLPVAHCIKGTSGWELEPKIKQSAEIAQEKGNKEVIFEKGIFGGEILAKTLREEIKNPSETVIELVGLCTDICVLSNAILLKTYMPEAVIEVDASCCAGVTPISHSNALAAMKMCQIHIINE